jgi:hypothetical protein
MVSMKSCKILLCRHPSESQATLMQMHPIVPSNGANSFLEPCCSALQNVHSEEPLHMVKRLDRRLGA